MPRKADPALRKKAETENQRARVEYDSECSALRKEKL